MSDGHLREIFQDLDSRETTPEEDILSTPSELVEETFGNSENTEEVLSEAYELGSSMEAIYEVFSNVVKERSSLDATAREVMKLSVDFNARQMNVDSTSLFDFTMMESGNKEELDIALESGKKTLDKIWDVIKTAIKRALRAIEDFFSKLTNGIVPLRRKLEDLQKRTRDLNALPEGKVTLSTASTLWYAGGVSSRNIYRGLEANIDAGVLLFGEYSEEAKRYYRTLLSKFADGNFRAIRSGDMLDRLINPDSGDTRRQDEVIFLKAVEKLTAADLLGGYEGDSKKSRFQISRNKITIFGSKVVTGWKFSRKDEVSSLNTSVEVERPDKRDLLQILEKSLQLLEIIDKEKKVITDLKKDREDLVKETEKAFEQLARSEASENIPTRKIRSIAKGAEVDVVRPIRQYTSYTFSSLRSIAQFADSVLTT